MPNAAQELAQFISEEISSLTVGENLFSWILPDGPDEAVVVRDTGGAPLIQPAMTDASFQVMARGKHGDPEYPHDILHEIQNLILAQKRLNETTLDGAFITTTNFFFRAFRSINGPQTIGIDSKQRPLMSFNVECMLTEVI